MIRRRRLHIALGCLFVLVSLYGLMGFFQGIMLFTGERALKNANLWGSVFLLASAAAVRLFLPTRASGSPSSPRLVMARRVVGALVVALGLWILLPVLRDMVAIDSCLDKGGSFDHVRSTCDFEQSHVSLSLFERQGFRLVAALALAFPALLAVAQWWQHRGKAVANAL
ncbi:hypothetical protein EEB15_29265 [Ramlibacter sp. WS9]|nr:hypothetical protein EEB15_29265 [Ramlibacter sp. WS9]